MNVLVRALVVEDEVEIRSLLSDYLAEFQFKEIIEASHGLEALEEFKTSLKEKKLFRLIISDISMPKMNGLEFYQRIESDLEKLSIPFLFISAVNGKEILDSIRIPHLVRLLDKPFSPSALKQTVSELII